MTTNHVDRITTDFASSSILEVLLKGHLWVELFLGESIAERVPLAHHLDMERLGFDQKVSLAAAVGALDAEKVGAYRRLNRMRNHAAHYLDRPPTQEEQSELEALLDPELRLQLDSALKGLDGDRGRWENRLKVILLVMIVNVEPKSRMKSVPVD